MNDLIKRAANLPADFGDSLMKGIEQTRATIGTGGGKPFMRLLRTGVYVYGQQNVEVQEGSRWAVNLAALEHGWVCWGDGELLGQLMASVHHPKPMRPPAVEGYQFEPQFSMELACIHGDDKGQEAVYKGNSLGYRKAYDALLADVRTRYIADQQFYWPVIELDTSSYPHKKYGQIFEPIFVIVGWADAQGSLQTAKPRAVAAPEPEHPVNASLTRARRAPAQPVDASAAAPAPETAAQPEPTPEPAPVSTTQARVGQRRRPAAR